MPIQDIWPKTAPNVVGDSQATAEAVLTALYIPFSYDDPNASGSVIAQTPASGSTMNLGDSMVLTLFSSQSDAALQDLLDPRSDFHGIRIVRRVNAPPDTISYYCIPSILYAGRAKWIDTPNTYTNQQKADYITAVLSIPI